MKSSGVIYRLGRMPDPWAVPDWASAGPDGTFGNRFDDPDATYRVLYASSHKLGCFLETLARFRLDPKLMAELAEIDGDDDHFPLGEVPVEWIQRRIFGVATAAGQYADICSSEWISRLRRALAGELERFGVDDVDASALQKTAPRILTQLVSRIVFYAGFSGIYYLSKYGHDIENWALFEPFQIIVRDPEPVRPMTVPVSVDRTSSGKEHFEVLDGLRGSAAFLIVIFHLFNYSFGFRPPFHLVHHAYLAVDFFFGLSGFVVAYAYADRWTRMTILQFFRTRLIRLRPLVLIGATLGLLGYIFDPFSKVMNHTAAPMLLLAYITSLLLLPSPPVGGRPGESQALNGPAWSLMEEYLGNIAYALILRRLRAITLAIIFGLSGLLLIWTANTKESLDGGWGYRDLWMVPLRLTVSFVMGLWLYRIHDRIRLPKIGLLILSIVLVACFQMPQFSKVGEFSLNGLYDAACVLFVFPLIILCGAHSNAGTGMIRLCKFSGHLSYPLYITHIPFVYVLAGFAWTRHPSMIVKLTWIFLLIPFVITLAWLALKYFDEPVRARLTRRYGIKRATALSQGREAIGVMMNWTFERFLRSAGQFLIFGFAFTAPLLAQEQTASARWHGLLQNSARAPIEGAKVRLAGTSTAESSTVADGSFALAGLPTGQYKLTIIAEGKTATYAQAITLTSDSPAVLITLSNRGEITVAAQQGTGATGGEALSSQAVSELPLNKRDFSSLLLLAAGTMTDTNGATNFTAQFAINGQRGAEATFAMDGADTSDPEMGGATFSNFNVDAVEGIDSSSGWMPADIGRGAAGFTNIHTRSGASGFHGSIFEFVRNSAFDARNYFDHPTPAYPGRIPPFRRNEFGFTNGGPIYIPHLYDGRNRTFYFAEYQGFRQVLGTTQVLPVPSAAQRPSGTSNIVDDTLNFPDGITDTLEVPVNASIASILARYPLPNLPTGSFGANTYSTASKVTTNADQFSLRIDHKLSAKNQFFARFTMDNLDGPTTNPDQTAIDPAFAVEYLDRQRNVVGTLATTFTPRLTLESSLSISRSTPGFPTPDHTDPAVKFEDGLFEAFNSAGGSVMQAYGNLFQERENFSYTAARHAVKAGFEFRENVDTTYFGTAPNGEYDFGGGTAYATEAIASSSGRHNINVGDPLPDTLSGFLSGSPFAYIVAVAPPEISGGTHIGPAAINRGDYNLYIEDTWKVAPDLTLDYGVRWEYYTPITERAHRTGGFRTLNGRLDYVVNPQPGYSTTWNGWGPRVQVSWAPRKNLTVHAGGAVTVIPPNIWQDNMLTGSTPFVEYPRRQSSSSVPLAYGFQITPSMLPTAYDLNGNNILANGTNKISPNTPMDVDRYETALASVTASGAVSALNLAGINKSFGNGTLYTWTLGLERKVANLTADLGYVGTAAQKLPRMSFPNAYPGATPEFAPYTEFNSAGEVTGGFGVMNLMTNDVHSNYNALQASLSGAVGHGGPGIQASYTFSKSIDTTSLVFGGTGSTGATTSGASQDPFDLRAEKGPSAFDATHNFGLSVAQDLHLESANFLAAIPRKFTYGWELLSISSISSGAPFTVYSGIQQTGAGANGVDRPDQIAVPKLSTARTNRQDYFGMGAANASTYFSIPVHIAGGTGPNQGRFGTLGRNTLRGPAYYDFDFAMIKDTPFGRRSSGAERIDLQFRCEFFNLFNIVNMGLPANILTGSGFGEISKTAGTSRQIQLSLKVIY